MQYKDFYVALSTAIPVLLVAALSNQAFLAMLKRSFVGRVVAAFYVSASLLSLSLLMWLIKHNSETGKTLLTLPEGTVRLLAELGFALTVVLFGLPLLISILIPKKSAATPQPAAPVTQNGGTANTAPTLANAANIAATSVLILSLGIVSLVSNLRKK